MWSQRENAEEEIRVTGRVRKENEGKARHDEVDEGE